jgi:hypothetical protein
LLKKESSFLVKSGRFSHVKKTKMDGDKKVVNTEEQNRAVNPGDVPVQEEAVSDDPVHQPEKAGTDRGDRDGKGEKK